MKLTLAMGLQYDNGKQASMLALSLGQNRAVLLQGEDNPLEAAVLESEQSTTMPVRQSHAPFFLTYNLKGLNDMLVFEQQFIDKFI